MKIFFSCVQTLLCYAMQALLVWGLLCVAYKLFVAQAFDINRVVVRGKVVCAVSFSIFLFIFV